MLDVKFTSAIIGVSNLVVNYTAQDFEALPIGVVQPFTYSDAQGVCSLGIDYITENPFTLNPFDSQDFESLPLGGITSIPPDSLGTATSGVILLVGLITPTLNWGGDDLESYPIGPITMLTQSASNGDITMLTGLIRTFP